MAGACAAAAEASGERPVRRPVRMVSRRCIMKGFSLAIWPAAAWLVLVVIAHSAAGADKEDLQGVWVATSGEINGQPASAEDLKRTRFTFKGDKLLVRLHKEDKQDSECSYKIRADKMPKQIDIGAGKKTLAGIYQVK